MEMTDFISIDEVFHTDGCGYWTDQAKPVKCNMIGLRIHDDEKSGEIRVFFDTKTWNVKTDSLIYTDVKFLTDVKGFLSEIGLEDESIDYTEAMMQGNHYVSLDCSENFIKKWKENEYC